MTKSIINSDLVAKARAIEENPRYANLTQADKAKLLGVSASTYSRAIHFKEEPLTPPNTKGSVESPDNTVKVDPGQSGAFYTLLLETNTLLREITGELKEMLKYNYVRKD